MRAYTNTEEIEADLSHALRVLRDALDPQDGTDIDTALCEVETFCTIAIKVFRKTNSSKIRDCARVVEIKARMDGIPVIA